MEPWKGRVPHMQITRVGVRTWATRGFLTVAGAILLGVVVQWFVQVAADKGWYAHAGQKWDRLVSELVALFTSAPVVAFAILLGGVVVGLRIDALLAKRDAVPSDQARYRDTRLRLRQDPSKSGHLLQVTCVNIDSWQQTVGVLSLDDGKGNVAKHQHDTLVIAFEGPLLHSRPIIETFGHKLPMYNYFALGDRGAIFQFSVDEMPPTFEIWFPPPDHYENASAAPAPVAPITKEVAQRTDAEDEPILKPPPPAPEEKQPPLKESERGHCKHALIELGNFLNGDLSKFHADLVNARNSKNLRELTPHINKFHASAMHAYLAAKQLQDKYWTWLYRMGGLELKPLIEALHQLQKKVGQVKQGVDLGWHPPALLEAVRPMHDKNLEVGKLGKGLIQAVKDKEAEFFGD